MPRHIGSVGSILDDFATAYSKGELDAAVLVMIRKDSSYSVNISTGSTLKLLGALQVATSDIINNEQPYKVAEK